MSFVHLDVGGNTKLKQRRDRKKKKIRRKKKEERRRRRRRRRRKRWRWRRRRRRRNRRKRGRTKRCWDYGREWVSSTSALVANKKLKQRREAEKKTLHLGPLILPFVLPRLLSSFFWIILTFFWKDHPANLRRFPCIGLTHPAESRQASVEIVEAPEVKAAEAQADCSNMHI